MDTFPVSQLGMVTMVPTGHFNINTLLRASVCPCQNKCKQQRVDFLLIVKTAECHFSVAMFGRNVIREKGVQ